MKKMITMVFLCCLLAGCNSQTQDTDDTKWNLNATSQTLNNTNAYMRRILPTEEHMITFQTARGEKGDGYLIETIQDNKVDILNNTPSSSCSIEIPDQCSSFIYGLSAPAYYKGKIYWNSTDYNQKDDTYIEGISRSNLDGTDKETIWKFKEDSFYNATTIPNFISFHQNQIFVVYNGVIYMGDIQDFKLKQIAIDGLENVKGLYFEGDTMYIYAENYFDKDLNKEYIFATISYNLKDNKISQIVSDNKETFFIDSNLQFYYGDNCVMLRNLKTNEEKKLSDGYCLFSFHDGDYYILDSILGNDNPYLMILDQDGNILDKKNLEQDKDGHTPQLFMKDKLYVTKDEGISYYEIKDNKILDFKEFVKYK